MLNATVSAWRRRAELLLFHFLAWAVAVFFFLQLAQCRFGDENVWSGFKICGERCEGLESRLPQLVVLFSFPGRSV